MPDYETHFPYTLYAFLLLGGAACTRHKIIPE